MQIEDDPRLALFAAIGASLHIWSNVELEISNLYMILHSIKRNEFAHPTRAAFEAVISLDVRLTMMCAYVAADNSLKDYLPHIKALKARVIKFYKKRHEVAHFMVVHRMNKGQVNTFIRPYFTEDNFQNKKGTELDSDQVYERAVKFDELVATIKRHIQHVGALRNLPPEAYVQAGDKAFPPLGKGDLPAAAGK
jgi:hypothetical protein